MMRERGITITAAAGCNPRESREAAVRRAVSIWKAISRCYSDGMTPSYIREHRTLIRKLARAHGMERVRVFGSRRRGATGPDRDLDLLVRPAASRDLLDLAAFKLDLEEALGINVDVVSEAGLSPYLRDRILGEARSV